MAIDLGQTISFDHAGIGWSTNTKSDRNIHQLVRELSIIIDTASSNKSIVLICHSLGSLEAIRYAQMQLASWSENSRQITLKNATHYLHWSNGEEVSSYINTFIKEEINKNVQE